MKRLLTALLDAVGRLGGAVATPHRTLVGVLQQGRGSIFEILPLALVAGVVVAPTSAGHALLMLRSSFADGLIMISQLVMGRFSYGLIGALVAAGILVAVDRARGGPAGFGFDRALDACGYALVPHFVLTLAGAALAAQGVELWFLPHRTVRGQGLHWLTMVAAGYAWSVVVFGVLLAHVWRVPREKASA